MKKRILIVLFLTCSIDLLLLACCSSPYYGFLKIENVQFENESLGMPVSQGNTISSEDFSLACKFTTSTIASNSYNGGFMATAYAMQPCPEDGELGLKTILETVVISTTTEIMGIVAGQPINIDGNIKVYADLQKVNDGDLGLSFSEWIEMLNMDFYTIYNEWHFKFQDNILKNKSLKFQITLTFEDGSILQAETKNIKIE